MRTPAWPPSNSACSMMVLMERGALESRCVVLSLQFLLPRPSAMANAYYANPLESWCRLMLMVMYSK
eukprot:scaffold33516_cov27-Tisochrysis_lutea.AAC.6